jgi:hypothetical protein
MLSALMEEFEWQKPAVVGAADLKLKLAEPQESATPFLMISILPEAINLADSTKALCDFGWGSYATTFEIRESWAIGMANSPMLAPTSIKTTEVRPARTRAKN